jgi:RNA polymerase sigma factor (sigma-70 family)
MSHHSVSQQKARILSHIQQLNQEQEWNLSASEEHVLTANIVGYLQPDSSDAQMVQTIMAYYQDHALVEALRSKTHTQHNEAWELWRSQVMAILNHANMLWSSDSAISSDDLVQIACLELAHALPRFRYASRFSTWARTVVVQRIQRHVRDSLALKRAQRPDSLDNEADNEMMVMDDSEPIANCAEAHVLAHMIETILASHPDPRLNKIYHLWIQEDRRVNDIGAMLHIHPSRVRQLIGQIRTFLHEHPGFQAWLAES